MPLVRTQRVLGAAIFKSNQERAIRDALKEHWVDWEMKRRIFKATTRAQALERLRNYKTAPWEYMGRAEAKAVEFLRAIDMTDKGQNLIQLTVSEAAIIHEWEAEMLREAASNGR